MNTLKSTATEHDEQEIIYPCLMISGYGNIYKFFSSHEGFLVHQNAKGSWVNKVSTINSLKSYHGKVTLEMVNEH